MDFSTSTSVFQVAQICAISTLILTLAHFTSTSDIGFQVAKICAIKYIDFGTGGGTFTTG